MTDHPAGYDSMFPELRASWDVHDAICESLPYFWAGRRGGVSCPSDLSICDDCDVMFYNEGVVWVNYERSDEDEIRLCGCCARLKGYVVKVTEYGVGI